MICKDCIKADVCQVAKEFKNNPVAGLSIGCCEHFIDRSKFIELLCRCGEKFYIITPKGRIMKKVVTSMSVGNDGIYCINSGSCFYFVSEIGKTVFFNREKAKQALKECESNV